MMAEKSTLLIPFFVYNCIQTIHVSTFESDYYYYNDTYAFSFGDNSTDKFISLEEVEKLIVSDDADKFLDQFSGGKYEVVKRMLLYCPYTRLCGFTFELNKPVFPNIAACMGCQCSEDCFVYGNCCPDILPDELFSFKHSNNQAHVNHPPTSENVDNNINQSNEAILNCPPFNNELLYYPEMTECEAVYGNISWIVYGFCGTGGMELDFDTSWMTTSIFLSIPQVRCVPCRYNTPGGPLTQYGNMPDISCGLLQKGLLAEDNYIRELILRKGKACALNLVSQVPPLVDRFCDIAISTCNISGQWFEFNAVYSAACASFHTPYLYNGTLYGNVFCLLCNGYVPYTTIATVMEGAEADVFTFSGLLSKGDTDADTDVETDPERTCPENDIYNTLTESCLKAFCSPVRRLVGGKCIRVLETMSGLMYTVYLRLIPTDVSVTLSTSLEWSENVVNWINQTVNPEDKPILQPLCSKIEIAHTIRYDNLSLLNMNNVLYSEVEYIDARLEIEYSEAHDPEIIFEFFASLNMARVEVVPVGYVAFLRDLKIGNELFRKSTEVSPLNSNYRNDKLVDLPIDKMIVAPNNRLILLDKVMDMRWFYCAIPAAISNFLVFNPCPKIVINKAEFDWKEISDGLGVTVFVMDTEIKLESHEYIYGDVNDTIIICIAVLARQKTPPKSSSSVDSVEYALSVIVIPMSFVSLVFMLIIYYVIGEFRVLPGANIMTLSTMLATAQALYLIGSYSRFEKQSILCKVFGMSIHFTWLLSVSWMNICTFNTFRVFARIRLVSLKFNKTMYIAYHMYGLCVSSLCVGINVLVSMLDSDGQDMGYGDGVCYINSQTLVQLTFGLPVGIMVCSNLAMFLTVVICISRTKIPPGTSRERNDLIIFAKLSTITGSMWVFGFLFTWTGYPAFSYIFILLNGGQGVFVCLSFILTRRVFSRLRKQRTVTQNTTIS